MEKATVFALKANIASWLLLMLFAVIPAFIFGESLVNFAESHPIINNAIALIIAFLSLYLATAALLENAKLPKAEALLSLKRTWQVYLILTIVSMLIGIKQIVEGDIVHLIFLLLGFVVAYAAVYLLERKQAAKP